MPLTIAVTRERTPGEHRVALVPETAKKFAALGAQLRMEQSAGTDSHFLDSDYTDVNLVAWSCASPRPRPRKLPRCLKARSSSACSSPSRPRPGSPH